MTLQLPLRWRTGIVRDGFEAGVWPRRFYISSSNYDLKFLRNPGYYEEAPVDKMLYTGGAVASIEAVSGALIEHGL